MRSFKVVGFWSGALMVGNQLPTLPAIVLLVMFNLKPQLMLLGVESASDINAVTVLARLRN
jgi:hypothetical protein